MTRRVRKHPHVGMAGAQRDFVKVVGELARGERSHSEVFDDFLEMSFCGIAGNTRRAVGDVDRADAFEARYMRLVGNRRPEYVRRVPELLGLLTIGLEEPCDFLGSVAGELGALSGNLGQFFTPFHLSVLCAQLTIDKELVSAAINERGYFDVDEPAAGAGGMLIAVAQVFEGLGFDVTHQLRARATDLSATAYQMCFIQLSLRGIAATVHHGNTLTLDQFDAQVTPGLLMQVAHQRTRGVLQAVRSAQAGIEALQTIQQPQLELFGGVL